MHAVVDCGDLPTLLNGLVVVDDTAFNDTAIYSCDKEYELVGNATRICLANGSWSGNQPSCHSKYSLTCHTIISYKGLLR